ncbi:MAG TPA: imidazolonepropionase [Dongiaceae bacterium]|nr:imidazolonepropionase [Dongiaceae bacterium]
MTSSLLITGASQILTLRGKSPRRGAFLSDLGIINNSSLLVRNGKILAVGPSARVEKHQAAKSAEKIDVGGRVVLPGFVDSHTHLIHSASRAEEYELKIQGASYEAIAKRGGGILNSVARLRAATSEQLKQRARAALEEFATYGTTTVEAKSGYGLDVTSELKILELHRELTDEQPIEIVSTFLGAHVLPAEYRGKRVGAEQYIELLLGQMLPEIVNQRLAEFCDVFCDRGAFSLTQSRRILSEAQLLGLTPRLHAEQLSRAGGTQLAVQLGAASCDHLEHVNAADIAALAKSPTVATLLPGCDFHLGWKRYAPARRLIEAGAIVALATDYNPGTSPTMSMPMILSLACTQLRMTPAEAIAAATINAAYALKRDNRLGSLEAEKQADFAVFEVEDYREIPYYFGMQRCWMTVKNGEIIYMKD